MQLEVVMGLNAFLRWKYLIRMLEGGSLLNQCVTRYPFKTCSQLELVEILNLSTFSNVEFQSSLQSTVF